MVSVREREKELSKKRKENNMAEKKMTRKAALENVLGWIADGYIPSDEATVEEVQEVLEKMHAQITKPRNRKPNTAKRDANIALGEKFAEIWDEESFKAANVAEILEVSKPKANAICKAMGWEEVPTTEKVKVYKL